MLGRKVFSALVVSICISLFLAIALIILNGPWEPFIMLIFIFSIYVVPVVFVFGVLTSILAERFSAKYTGFSQLVSLALHIGFGLLFFIPLNFLTFIIFQEFIGVNIYYLLFSGLAGGIFYFVDWLVKYIWDKSDSEQMEMIVEGQDSVIE